MCVRVRVMSCRAWESCIIEQPIEKVWPHLRSMVGTTRCGVCDQFLFANFNSLFFSLFFFVFLSCSLSLFSLLFFFAPFFRTSRFRRACSRCEWDPTVSRPPPLGWWERWALWCTPTPPNRSCASLSAVMRTTLSHGKWSVLSPVSVTVRRRTACGCVV